MWSVFGNVHTLKRNRLANERVQRLVAIACAARCAAAQDEPTERHRFTFDIEANQASDNDFGDASDSDADADQNGDDASSVDSLERMYQELEQESFYGDVYHL